VPATSLGVLPGLALAFSTAGLYTQHLQAATRDHCPAAGRCCPGRCPCDQVSAHLDAVEPAWPVTWLRQLWRELVNNGKYANYEH
jgi:hypothetical protein